MTIDLDADVGGFGLPVQLGIADTEKVQATDDLLGGDAHQADLGGVAADFRRPEAEQLLVRLDTLTLNGGGGPVEVNNTFNLDASLVEKVHAGQFVDGDGVSGVQTSDVLVVGRPLESRPLQLGSRLALLDLGGLKVGEGTQRLSSSNIPDDIVLALIVDGENTVGVVGDGNRAVGPSDQVVFVGREGDEVDEGVRETAELAPGLATPQDHALGVDRSEIRAQRRPLQEGLGPVLTVDNVLGLISLVVPENTDVIATIHDELVAATARGVLEPPSEVLALLERRDCGGVVGLVHSSFGSVSLNIADLVDAQNVLLVEGHHIELAGGGLGLSGGGVLYESKSGWRLAKSL